MSKNISPFRLKSKLYNDIVSIVSRLHLCPFRTEDIDVNL